MHIDTEDGNSQFVLRIRGSRGYQLSTWYALSQGGFSACLQIPRLMAHVKGEPNWIFNPRLATLRQHVGLRCFAPAHCFGTARV